jgi:hypothetical protein
MRSLVLCALLLFTNACSAVVEFRDNQFFIDNIAQPQLFGAELQYFRLRGGYGKNIPREKVLEIWNRALDRMVEAKMNTISFYIPWDFHEYADGKYDFTGTVDEDGDGLADYPSRDIVTFFKLIEAHGIKKIMVRPGPYINAEWGFLGFGAIPEWFHHKFPDSHMRNVNGLKTKLYDYHNPDFLKYSERWIGVVYNKVLKEYIGPDKPIAFVQLDNETNFQWQSLYNHDFGRPTILRYQKYLQNKFKTIDALNRAHSRSWRNWNQVEAPKSAGINKEEDQDWYSFQDLSIHDYLVEVRRMWERLGVKEPNVLFTLAESYNATRDGLLPSYEYRNDPGQTGMMTVNLYPKTYELDFHPLMNLPFKADQDVKSADSANDLYLGDKVEWVFGPEIQAGWWKGIDVTPESRRQTYLTTIGHGLKGLMVYYFNEGDNWQVEWAKENIKPFYDSLRNSSQYRGVNERELPSSFWDTLQSTVDRELLVGFDVRFIWSRNLEEEEKLYFDSPLNGLAKPSKHFEGLKEVGEKLVAPYGKFLGRARAMTDDVCLVRDGAQHMPTKVKHMDSVVMNSDWMGGLVGYLLQTGINPRIHHWGLNPESDLDDCKILIHQDNGIFSKGLSEKLSALLNEGHTVINFFDNQLSQKMGLNINQRNAENRGEWVSFVYENTHSLFSANPMFYYDLGNNSNCKNIIFHNQESVAYQCQSGKGTFVQVGAHFYGIFNSDVYAQQSDVAKKRTFIEYFLKQNNIQPKIQIKEGGDRLAIFGRTDGTTKMITLKSGQLKTVANHLIVRGLDPKKSYQVKDIFGDKSQLMTGQELSNNGFLTELKANGSTVVIVTPVNK